VAVWEKRGSGGACAVRVNLTCFAGFLAYFKMMPELFGGCGTLARRGRYVMLRITMCFIPF